MKVAIIGASTKRNGIGQYIAKYFQQNGASVTAVLGTTTESSIRASLGLKKYGITASAYADFDCMMERGKPDIVVIASPAETHYHYLIKSIERSVHIFCEKPFICPATDNIHDMHKNIFKTAKQKNILIAMNSQWPFSLPFYTSLCGSLDNQNITSFFIRLSPTVAGKAMIIDSLPHALSMLYSVLGNGDIAGLHYKAQGGGITLQFAYRSEKGGCHVHIALQRQSAKPRSFSFGFNNAMVKRIIDMKNYDIFLQYKTKTLKIEDPLNLSVKDFLSALKSNREPLIGKSHIIHTMYLLQKIYDQCCKNTTSIKNHHIQGSKQSQIKFQA